MITMTSPLNKSIDSTLHVFGVVSGGSFGLTSVVYSTLGEFRVEWQGGYICLSISLKIKPPWQFLVLQMHGEATVIISVTMVQMLALRHPQMFENLWDYIYFIHGIPSRRRAIGNTRMLAVHRRFNREGARTRGVICTRTLLPSHPTNTLSYPAHIPRTWPRQVYFS